MPTTTTPLRGWCICHASNVMHYIPKSGGTPMCGLSDIQPIRLFQPQRQSASDRAEKCNDCDQRHYIMWRDGKGVL